MLMNIKKEIKRRIILIIFIMKILYKIIMNLNKIIKKEIKNLKIIKTIIRIILKKIKNISKAGYNDTINNNEEPISYRGKAQIKGKRRILSTRVHIRGVNSSKNFNNIL